MLEFKKNKKIRLKKRASKLGLPTPTIKTSKTTNKKVNKTTD